MKIKASLFAACLLLLLGSCGDVTKNEDEFLLKGHITGLHGKAMHLERIIGVTAEPVAEVPVDDDGNFEVAAKGEENMIYQLRVDKVGSMLLIPEFSTLTIEADADELQAFRVEGNAKSKTLRDFNLNQYRLYLDYRASESRLDGLDRQTDTTDWHALEAVTDKAMMAYRSYMRTFCDTVGLPVLRAHAALSLTINGNYHYLRKLTERLDKENPGSAAVAALRSGLEEEGKGHIGEVAPIFTGKDLAGKPFDLNALRGKPVLVYFWASYCEFSRAENAKLASLAQVFADNQVTLVCFSIDDSDQDWRDYLATANLGWATHIRGLNGTASAEIGQYGVKAIPANYLIDANGVIRDLDIRADEIASDLAESVRAKAAHP